jgi:hypothetical protein
LNHHNITIDDPLGQHFLQLLDGTHNRHALLDDLAGFVAAGGANVHGDGQPVEAPGAVRQRLATELERKLTELARLALFVA